MWYITTGTSGNGDSCDLFNCCMLGLTIMM